MKVIVTRQFAKDVEKELNKSDQLKLADIVEELQSAGTIQELKNIKKLKG